MKRQQSQSSVTRSGFTLIDLTVVMIILGIMAASALPRLINLTNDARLATMDRLEGRFNSAIDRLHVGQTATGSSKPAVLIGTEGSDNDYQLPKSDEVRIGKALASLEELSVDDTMVKAVTFQLASVESMKCQTSDIDTTGVVSSLAIGCKFYLF